ncbi:protein DESIGUAL 3-like [Impatiens glandulifera]|uniref:protein DESIGUAL 3-like n=1 Tax=Impatiens glandulifera TaxID=253017 RepID=UPI001FB1179F|nr:protein DESIGUAL 3-like [Impatiens glandulifera]
MAKNIGIIVCLVVMIIDIVAGVLGIEAEAAQNKARHMQVWIFECREPIHAAFRLGLAAAILLAVSHFIAIIMGGCTCIWSKQQFDKASPNKQLAVASLIFSWIIFVVSFSMMLVGAFQNSRSEKKCTILHRRLLFIGGILCFIHGMFAVAYYVSASAANKEAMKLPTQHTNQHVQSSSA